MYPSRANSGVNLKYYRREVTQNIWDEIYRARNLTNNPREISFWCSKSFGGQQAFVTHHIAAVFPMKNSPQLPVVSHEDERIPVWRVEPSLSDLSSPAVYSGVLVISVWITVSPQARNVSPCAFVRCSRAWITLHVAVGDVAHGRGQRCTWPWTTNKVALRVVLEVSEDGYACGGLTKGIVDLPLGMLWGIDAVREGSRNQEKGWTLGEFNNKQRQQGNHCFFG